MSRRIEPQREQFPHRIAAHVPHPDLAESHRAHGTVHTSGGRILPGWKLAVADAATQASRLADPTGWTHHVAVAPSPLAIQGARAYASLKGLPDPHDTDYTHIMQSPERVARVGRHFDALPTYSPEAVPHFAAMADEVNHQYDFLTNRLGIRVQPVDYDPYAHVGEMMADVANNKTLKVLGSHVTGGHPVFGTEGNDRFRAVHDFFGHAATGRDFDRHGEHATYLAHAKMFTPAALPALTTETLGQNSSLILNGHFGPNKIGIIPRELTAVRRQAARDDGWDDMVSDDVDPLSMPVHLRTPRWNEHDRPRLPSGAHYFSPTEVNPPSNSPARPSTSQNFTYETDHPALPLDTPGAGVEWNEYDEAHMPVDRIPTELHRGLRLDIFHPALGRVRRLLYGPDKEEHFLPSDSLFYHPDSDLNVYSDHEIAAPVLPGASPYRHPDLPHLLLDHLRDNDFGNFVADPQRYTGGLGRHWSTSLAAARLFSGVQPYQTRFSDNQINAVLSGQWKGLGEDPYRRYTDGDFDDEHEITLLPGAPLHIHRMHVFDPHLGNWHTIPLHEPQRREAKGKKKKKAPLVPTMANPGKPQRSPYYRDWSGPKPMWFATADGIADHEEIFAQSHPKQLYQLLRTDNTFAQRYREWLRTQGQPPTDPREMVGARTGAVTVAVGSQYGLHTTPSLLISNAVKKTGWPVWLSDKAGTRIDARDPLAIMSLGARHGAPITVHCDHPETAARIADYVARDHD